MKKGVTLILLTFSSFAFGQINLLDFKNSTCDEPTLFSRLRTRIVKKEIKDDVLTVEIATVETCCVTFEPAVSTKEGILYLDVRETGAECECDCYYFLTYKIQGIKHKD